LNDSDVTDDWPVIEFEYYSTHSAATYLGYPDQQFERVALRDDIYPDAWLISESGKKFPLWDAGSIEAMHRRK
jgi:hypothetical protein